MVEDTMIRFDELVKVRKDEMYHMLPRFYAEVKDGDTRSKKVYSPSSFEKASLKIRGMSTDD